MLLFLKKKETVNYDTEKKLKKKKNLTHKKKKKKKRKFISIMTAISSNTICVYHSHITRDILG